MNGGAILNTSFYLSCTDNTQDINANLEIIYKIGQCGDRASPEENHPNPLKIRAGRDNFKYNVDDESKESIRLKLGVKYNETKSYNT